MVLAAPGEILERRLRLERVGERRILGGVQEPLRQPDRHRWALRKPLRELASGVGEAIGGDDRGNESEVVGVAGAQLALAHEDLERAMPADPADQDTREARVGNEADAAEGGDEARLLGRDDDVRRERQADAGSGGHAVDGRDDGLREVANRLDERVVFGAEHGTEVTLAGPAAQVGPGAEATARAGDHDGANGLVAGGGLQGARAARGGAGC